MPKMKKRARGSAPTRTTITMTKLDKERLDQLCELLKGTDGRKPSGSLALSEVMLSVLVDWSFKHGFGPKHTEVHHG